MDKKLFRINTTVSRLSAKPKQPWYIKVGMVIGYILVYSMLLVLCAALVAAAVGVIRWGFGL